MVPVFVIHAILGEIDRSVVAETLPVAQFHFHRQHFVFLDFDFSRAECLLQFQDGVLVDIEVHVHRIDREPAW